VSAAAAAWDDLGAPWRACLELAWSAYGAGTIPVGAAVVDGAGTIVANGRNPIYERRAPPGQIANSLLAHAEVNALVGLDPERRYEDHALYTALGPCLLCVGAAVMATVGRVRYAGADPYGGGDGASSASTRTSKACRSRSTAPRDDPIGRLASALLVAFFLRRKPGGHVVGAYAARAPHMLPVARALLAARAPERAAPGVALRDALPDLRDALA
jgi:tRNA(adenine34) deaminase